MFVRLNLLLSKLRQGPDRAEWAMRLLGLSRCAEKNPPPGLILLQIDGLARPQFQKALSEGRLPFLKKLMHGQGYQLHSLYSGLPSATPGVQGELFYGVKGCVPSFSFLDRKDGKIRRMFDVSAAVEVEKQLAKQGRPLLEGGSAYADIFSGGANECHFGGCNRGWDGILRAAHPLKLPFLLLLYADWLVRLFALLGWELLLGLYQGVRGWLRGGFLLRQELEFISIRLSVCIFLRELITAGVRIDIARGLPVIHLNLFGYDEQSHRRGPGSAFAHWVLPGIDAEVRRIWEAALRSNRRHYDLWVYSDHGQEETVPYKIKHARTLQQAAAAVLRREVPELEPSLVVTGMGPIAHLYVSRALSANEEERIAAGLLESAEVPTVLAASGPGKATAWTEAGSFSLPQDASRVLGNGHPFPEETAEDLASVCHHPHAGDLIALAWGRGRPAHTFPLESGSHAGPGFQETHAFALLPPDAPLDLGKAYLRPLDLRNAALRFLGRLEPSGRRLLRPAPSISPTLRIMTYNVHNCLGMDGKVSMERIARVIARLRPDAVVLQELDVNRVRTGHVDQAESIAKKLEMTFHFCTSFRLEDEQYGNAVLSRYPMRLVKAGGLPRMPGAPVGEPRSALWVELDIDGACVHLIATHLSLWPAERLKQAEALLGPDWVGHPEARGPMLLCGDFNASPGSSVYRRLTQQFKDAQTQLKEHSPRGTWYSRRPFSRIDHIFLSPGLEVTEILVPDTELDRAASDHLPLLAEVRVNVIRPAKA